MRKASLLLLACTAVMVFVSCQKEGSVDNSNGGGGDGTGKEVGTWKFISLHANTNVTVELSDGVDNVKTVSLSEYTSTNNSGTIKFDGSKAVATGLAYTVDFIVKGYIYENGSLVDEVEQPLNMTIPAYTSTANYTRIGTDSLSFPAGGLITFDSGGGSTPTDAAGYKLRFEGDKMYMTTNVNRSETITDQGITQKTIQKATAEVTLQKQ